MCVEIELVGGIVDGKRLTICCDPMNPDPVIEVAEPLPVKLVPLPAPGEMPDPSGSFQRVRYARDLEPTRADTGPLWLYRRQAPQTAA
jgi:hypothetical protein